MEGNTANPKNSFFKQNINYPILLLILISLTNISDIISGIVQIFNFPGAILSTLLQIVVSAAPLILAFLLWQYKAKNFQKAAVAIAAVIAVKTIVEVYIWVKRLIVALPGFSFEIEYITWTWPILLGPLFSTILGTILAINLYTKRGKYSAFYPVAILYIVELCFFGLLRIYAASLGMGPMGTAISGFVQVFYVLALWYIPKAINDPPAAELSTGKAKALAIIAGLVAGIYIIAAGAVGTPSHDNMNGWGDYDYDHDGNIDDKEFNDGWNDYIDDFLN